MELEMRPVTQEEVPAFVVAVEAAFADVLPPEEAALWEQGTDPARTLAVFDAGEIVGNAATWAMELTLPGLVTVPAGGISAVGVQPTHRRQGLLTRMMERVLDDCLERGEDIAILTASEAGIYGRFGFGWATSMAEVEIECDHSAFVAGVAGAAGAGGAGGAGGRIRRIDTEAARKIAPAVHDRVRRQTVGDVSVPQPLWELMAADFDRHRDGAGPLFFAVHESASGEPDGFVGYRYKPSSEHGVPKCTVSGSNLYAETPEVEAALIRYLLDLDLVAKLRLFRPELDPLRLRMFDPRRYQVHSLADHLWVRLVDVAAGLALRRYTADGSVVLKVRDRFRPQNEGVYLLEGGPDGAVCGHARPGEEPDLEVTVEALGSAFLGGVGFTTLAAAGRCIERKPGGLRRADALFLTDTPPYCRSGF